MLQPNLIHKYAILMMFSGALVACEKSSIQQQSPTPQMQTASTPKIADSSTVASTANVQGDWKKIDWQKIDSGEKAIDPKTFNYLFELDSDVVQMYAKEYNIDKISARYQMTVGMAVNELLSKLLDQLDTSYVSHEIVIDKADSMPILKVHTTPNVENFSAEYVFADTFAKGLSIKVQIINDGVKQPIKNPHSE